MSEQKIYQIDPSTVKVPTNRQRKTIDPVELNKLADSIKEIGQLVPAICHRVNGETVLIAGERRLLACQKANVPYSYILKEEIADPLLLYQIELEENVCRVDLPWEEKVKAIAGLHEIYERTKGSSVRGSSDRWNMRKSAEAMGMSLGSLSEKIELADWAAKVPEVAKAKTETEAKKIVKKYKAMAVQQKTLNMIAAASPKAQEAEGSASDDPKTASLKRLAAALDHFNKSIHEQRMQDFLEAGSETYDIVFFDPPWGVGLDEVFDSAKTKAYSDDEKKFLESFPEWISLIYSVMKPNSHLYLKFGIVHHHFVYSTLAAAGFTVNGMPIFWHKQGAHRTRQPLVWPGRCYEPIAYARKGSKDLIMQGAPDIITTPAPTPTMKDIHPSALHPDLVRELLLRSAFPGDKFLDPMAGSGMSGVAAESLREKLGLSYDLIEKDPDFCNLIRKNLLKGYASIVTTSTAEATLDDSADYRSTTPGSPEWMAIWSAHPELHNEMMEFSKGSS